MAKQLTDNRVVLLTIAPVEKGKPLGEQYFSPGKIQAFNRIIFKLAEKHRVLVMDSYSAFKQVYSKEISFTKDGVHLNVPSYSVMKKLIVDSTSTW